VGAKIESVGTVSMQVQAAEALASAR